MCSVDGCENTVHARSYCMGHYSNWSRHGNPVSKKPRGPYHKNIAERWAAWTSPDPDTGCLMWLGPTASNGYGQVIVYPGKRERAHRWAWERVNGSIPEGALLDHICRNRRCVEVSHLRLVTPKQNVENVSGPFSHGSTGALGVTWDKTNRKYRAKVKHAGKYLHIGRFESLAEAAEAARKRRLELFTHNDHDRAVPHEES